MSDRLDPIPSVDAYSPQRRTGLVLTGVGTAGAYHAGVLRALHEAGVKIDIVAGRGIGVLGAVFAAIDGAQQLWSEKGFWRAPIVRRFYRWLPAARLLVWSLAIAVTVVAVPLLAVAGGLVVYPIDFVLKMIGVGGSVGLIGEYLRVVEAAFAPGGLPTWLPRLAVIVLGAGGIAAAVSGWISTTVRPSRGAFWWNVAPPPMSTREVGAHAWRVLWDLLRGATPLKQPTPAELGRRYVELLSENIGQPGFRELVLTVHDLDAHRDLIFAMVAEPRRRDLLRRSTSAAAEARRAEVLDLSGVARDHLADALAAAFTVPVATAVHPLTFAPESYWRGETHRLCDRPGALTRLLDELADLGVEQAIVVSGSPDSPGPHALTAPRLDLRGRIGEFLQSAEAAAIADVTRRPPDRLARLFTIRPAHNPIGPFDGSGGYDDRSHRVQGLSELMHRGYEDAYQQFIEPVVGASGERVGQGVP